MPYFDNHIENTGQHGEVIFMTAFLVLRIVGGLCAVVITKAAKSKGNDRSAAHAGYRSGQNAKLHRAMGQDQRMGISHD